MNGNMQVLAGQSYFSCKCKNTRVGLLIALTLCGFLISASVDAQPDAAGAQTRYGDAIIEVVRGTGLQIGDARFILLRYTRGNEISLLTHDIGGWTSAQPKKGYFSPTVEDALIGIRVGGKRIVRPKGTAEFTLELLAASDDVAELNAHPALSRNQTSRKADTIPDTRSAQSTSAAAPVLTKPLTTEETRQAAGPRVASASPSKSETARPPAAAASAAPTSVGKDSGTAAKSMQAARAHLGRNEYAAAFKLFQPLANEGSLEAQYRIGKMYEYGLGLAKDAGQGQTWYRKAADRAEQRASDPGGMVALSEMYGDGKGVGKDEVKSAAWARKAAETGYPEGQLRLGLLTLLGAGVPEDAAQSAAWIRKAAEQGHAEAQLMLGVAYDSGKGGVPKNRNLSIEWFQKAAAQGNNAAKTMLKGMGAPLQPQSKVGGGSGQVNCSAQCTSRCTVYGSNTGAFGQLDSGCFNACNGGCETQNRINEYQGR